MSATPIARLADGLWKRRPALADQGILCVGPWVLTTTKGLEAQTRNAFLLGVDAAEARLPVKR